MDTQARYPLPTLLKLVGAFLVVHLGYWTLGIRYDAGSLETFMHFLDPPLLKERLLESVWYLHIQPPFMNLFAGLVLKLTPESTVLFHAMGLLHGFLLYMAVFLLQRRFKIRPTIATLTSTLFMASPTFILYEHFLLYTLPCAAWLALACLFLVDYFATGKRRYALGIFLCVMLLCGTRSAFHIGFFAIVIALVLIARRDLWKQSLVLATVPFLIIFGIYFKNLLIFGEFTMCTFVEKNLWIMTAGNLSGEQKQELVEAGEVSEFTYIMRWASLDAYPPEYKEVPEHLAHIPALTQTHKTIRAGEVNYNHYGNIAVCNVYGDDAKYVLFNQPKAFILATSLSWYRYFLSSSTSPVAPDNQARIAPINAFYDYVLYGKCWVDLRQYNSHIERAGYTPFFFLLLGLPLLLAFGTWRAFRPLLPNPPPDPMNIHHRTVVGFMCFCIFMVAALGCTFDFLETARYRFITDGLSVVLLGLAVDGIVRNRTKNN